MTKIVIGKSEGKNVSIDLDVLLTTRLLLTADSGGGKTFALKRLCEQAFGKLQIIIIDPEGEFAPMRQKYDFVLVGPGGETPADVRSSAMLAVKLLELRASAICDIYDMKPSVRHT
jgi:DNA helicase HerA-like ATPase